MNTMDRRMALRRHNVTEGRARTRLRLILGGVALLGIVAAAFWAIRSPLLSVDEISINGAERSNPSAVVDALGIAVGIPTVDVDAAALETALLGDPWVAEAAVDVTWPGTVTIDLVEHVPVAMVTIAGGLAQVSAGGDVLAPFEESVAWPVIVVADPTPAAPGDRLYDPLIAGALEFIGQLPPELAAVTTVTISQKDLLDAAVDGYQVRLGRGVEMRSKAAALVGLLAYGLPPGSAIDVTAPRRPAVAQPSSSS